MRRQSVLPPCPGPAPPLAHPANAGQHTRKELAKPAEHHDGRLHGRVTHRGSRPRRVSPCGTLHAAVLRTHTVGRCFHLSLASLTCPCPRPVVTMMALTTWVMVDVRGCTPRMGRAETSCSLRRKQRVSSKENALRPLKGGRASPKTPEDAPRGAPDISK